MHYVVTHYFLKENVSLEMMAPHLEYLKKLLKQGKLVITGPFTDSERGGMFILEVENEEELTTIVNNDPAIRDGIARSEVRPYKIFLQRQIIN